MSTPYTSASSPAVPSGESYPKVDDLEQKMLHTTYKNDDLATRVSRLETKDFGKTYANDALCDRIDRLCKKEHIETAVAPDSDDDSSNGASRSTTGSGIGRAGRALASFMGGALGGGGGMMFGPGVGGMGLPVMPYMGRGMGMYPAYAPPPSSSPQQNVSHVIQNPFSADAQPVTTTEARVTAMEKFVFGHERASMSIEERVALLEKKLVPYQHNNATQDLSVRVTHLWSMLAAANSQASTSSATK